MQLTYFCWSSQIKKVIMARSYNSDGGCKIAYRSLVGKPLGKYHSHLENQEAVKIRGWGKFCEIVKCTETVSESYSLAGFGVGRFWLCSQKVQNRQ
jgi:hypothetical protein